MRGTLETIVGAMFAGKTSELLKRILWAEHQGKRIVVIKSKVDNRYSEKLISTHNDLTHNCFPMVGWDDVKREAFGDTVINTIARFAPNIKDIILHRQVLTPKDIESTYGLTEGNIFHGELTLQQLFALRPAAKWANYTTPIQNYYQCGSGTHPGGGVTGSPGEMAAKNILRKWA